MVAILKAMAGSPNIWEPSGAMPARYSEARNSRRGLRFSGCFLTPICAASIWALAFSENRLTISGAVPKIGMISVSVSIGLMTSLVGAADAADEAAVVRRRTGGFAAPSAVVLESVTWVPGMVHSLLGGLNCAAALAPTGRGRSLNLETIHAPMHCQKTLISVDHAKAAKYQ